MNKLFAFVVLVLCAAFPAFADTSPNGVVVQRIVSRLRENVTNCNGTLVIPGMRRTLTTTTGNYVRVQWFGSAVTNAAVTEANWGVSLHVDGIAPEYGSFKHENVTAPGSGHNFLVGGDTTVYVTPGTHVFELRCHVYVGGSFGFTPTPYNNQQENGLTMVIEEVKASDWDVTQIPQVVNTDQILMADWRADKGVTVDASQRVITWADQSGNNNNLSQVSTGLRPLLVQNCQNGLPCLRFDPTRKDELDLSMAESTAQRVIVLMKHNSQAASTVSLVQCSGAACSGIDLGTANDKPRITSGGTRVQTASNVTGVHMLEFRWNTSAALTGIRTDLGLTAARTEELGLTVNTPGTFTKICGDNGGGVGCDGDIYEIQIWGSNASFTDLTATDDNYVRDELNKRWLVYAQPNDL